LLRSLHNDVPLRLVFGGGREMRRTLKRGGKVLVLKKDCSAASKYTRWFEDDPCLDFDPGGYRPVEAQCRSA